VATYAGDAVAMRLPLVTPGGGHPIHDWNYVLGALGWLRHTTGISDAIRLGAHASMLVGLGGMIAVLAEMRRAGGARASSTPGRPRGGGLAARPRETSLRPWREPDPPWIAAPSVPSTSRPSRPPPDAERSPGGPPSPSRRES
jgi:hypothetical protein